MKSSSPSKRPTPFSLLLLVARFHLRRGWRNELCSWRLQPHERRRRPPKFGQRDRDRERETGRKQRKQRREESKESREEKKRQHGAYSNGSPMPPMVLQLGSTAGTSSVPVASVLAPSPVFQSLLRSTPRCSSFHDSIAAVTVLSFVPNRCFIRNRSQVPVAPPLPGAQSPCSLPHVPDRSTGLKVA